jgi:hypothetical protein
VNLGFMSSLPWADMYSHHEIQIHLRQQKSLIKTVIFRTCINDTSFRNHMLNGSSFAYHQKVRISATLVLLIV